MIIYFSIIPQTKNPATGPQTTATIFVSKLWTQNPFSCRPTLHGFNWKRPIRVISWKRWNSWAPIPDKL